jgi:hypothetical protein
VSLSPAAIAARATVTRSDRLFFDTRNLTYVAGIAREEVLEPAVVKELLDAGELRVIDANANGVITMELTVESFKRGIAGRSRVKAPQKVVWAHFASINVCGIRLAGHVFDGGLLGAIFAVPFNGPLLSKLLNATNEAIASYRQDPRHTGSTIRFPGHILPGKSVEVRDSPLDAFPLFEAADLRIMINAANGQYAVTTHARGVWLVSPSEPITRLLGQAAQSMGERVGRSVLKLAERLERDPLIGTRTIHPDEESLMVTASIKDAEGAKKNSEVSA